MEYFKNKDQLYKANFLMICCNTIALMWFYLTDDESMFYVVIGCLVFACLNYCLLHKYLFTRVRIDDFGIKLIYNKKEINSIKWSEIKKIDLKAFMNIKSLGIYYAEEKYITFDALNKDIEKIIKICPREDLKEQLKIIRNKFCFKKKIFN